MPYVIGFLLFTIGQILIWLNVNSQFVWEWWKDKPLLTSLIYSVPTSMIFWYASKSIVEQTGEIWSARFVGFGASYLVFPLMTYYLANESMFTFKTLTCTFLSVIILCIQIFYK